MNGLRAQKSLRGRNNQGQMKTLNKAKINLKTKERKVIIIMKIKKLARRLKRMKNKRMEKKFKPNLNMTKILTSLIKLLIQL